MSPAKVAIYEQAIAALRSMRLAKAIEGDVDQLTGLMLRACERARKWTPATDLYRDIREKDLLFLQSGLPSMMEAVSKLQRVGAESGRAFDEVVWRAVKATGITPDMMRAAGYPSNAGGQGGRFLRALLSSLHDQLEAEASPRTRVAIKGQLTGGRHRHIHGPLCYPVLVDNKRMPDPVLTGLQFELVFYTRHFTAGRRLRQIEIDDVLPKYGQACFPVIAEFVQAALGIFRDGTGEAFNKAMKSNSGGGSAPVRWWGWGAPEGFDGDESVIAHWGSDTDD